MITISSECLSCLHAEAARAHPHECCGILLGAGYRIAAIRPARNVHPDPARRFEIDPQALVDAHRSAREGGPQILGYYHSHPNGRSEPSATDRAQATGDGRIWAIVAGNDVTLWRDAKTGFSPLSYTVADA